MAKQVGPQERKPECSAALRARTGDEDVLGEFHQGPQAEIQLAIRPDIRLQPIHCFTKTRQISCKTGRRPCKIVMLLNASPTDSADLIDLFAPSVFDKNRVRRKGVAPGSFSIDLTNEEYHADRTGYSCSSLKTMLRSPAHFLASRNAPHEESSSSQNLGTATHTAVLEPHLFDTTVTMWDGGRRAGKAYDEFKAANTGKIILSVDEMAAVKAMPLGQTAGQRMLLNLGEAISRIAGEVLKIPLEEASNFLPAFSIASCLHETQYARLFKS